MRLGLLLFFAVFRAPWCQSDPQTLRVRDYFNLLTTARGPERQKLLLADISRRPISRPMIPDQDVPVLVEILNGSDPDLAASAASHLVLMALQQGGRLGQKPPEIVASALPAMASHFDDENPPVMEENADWTVHPIGSRFWRHEVLSY